MKHFETMREKNNSGSTGGTWALGDLSLIPSLTSIGLWPLLFHPFLLSSLFSIGFFPLFISFAPVSKMMPLLARHLVSPLTTLLFSSKNHVYKNVEAQIANKIRTS